MFTKDELNQLSVGVEALVNSAKRAQKTSNNPMITDVHKRLQTQLEALRTKVHTHLEALVAEEVNRHQPGAKK